MPEDIPGKNNPNASVPAGNTKNKGSNNVLTGVIILLVFCLIAAGLTYAWKKYREGEFGTSDNSKETQEESELDENKSDDSDRTLFEDEEEEESELTGGEPAELELFEGMFDEDEYTVEHFTCDAGDGTEYWFDLWYPDDFITLRPGPGVFVGDPDCDIELVYEDSVLSIRFNVGDAPFAQISEGYEVLKSETGKVLARSAIAMNGDEHVFSYIMKVADSECVPTPSYPTVAPPCAFGIHPFMPASTLVQAVVPGDVGASVLSDIAELFDDMAILMHGGVVE